MPENVIGSAYVALDAKLKKFEQNLSRAERRLNFFKKTADRIGRGVAKAGRVIITSFVAIGAAVAVASIALTKMASNFEYEMAKVRTLLKEMTEKDFKIMKAEVSALAADLGKPAKEVANAYYELISAGADVEQSLDLLRVAGQAAVGGFTSVRDAVDFVSPVLKGYNMEWKEAIKIYDLGFKTVEKGKTTFAELARSVGRVVPLAAKLEMKVEELFGAFGTLTGVTGNTAEVSTQLAAILTAFLKPPEALANEMKQLQTAIEEAIKDEDAERVENLEAEMEKLRKVSQALSTEMIKKKGLQGALKELVKAVDGNEVALAKLIGRKEAIIAMFALTGAQADDFREKTDAMAESAGSLEKATRIMSNTLTVKWRELKQTILDFMRIAGEPLLDQTKKIIDKIKEWTEINEDLIKQKISEWMEKATATVETFWRKVKEIDWEKWARAGEKAINTILIPAFDKLSEYVAKTTGIFEEFIREMQIPVELRPVMAGLEIQAEVAKGLKPALNLMERESIKELEHYMANLIKAYLATLKEGESATEEGLAGMVKIFARTVKRHRPDLEEAAEEFGKSWVESIFRDVEISLPKVDKALQEQKGALKGWAKETVLDIYPELKDSTEDTVETWIKLFIQRLREAEGDVTEAIRLFQFDVWKARKEEERRLVREEISKALGLPAPAPEQETFEEIQKWAQEVQRKRREEFQKLLGLPTEEAEKDAEAAGKKIGQKYIDSLIKTLKANKDNLRQVLKELLEELEVTESHSPPILAISEMVAQGQKLMTGLAQGIANSSGVIRSAMAGAIGSLNPSFALSPVVAGTAIDQRQVTVHANFEIDKLDPSTDLEEFADELAWLMKRRAR